MRGFLNLGLGLSTGLWWRKGISSGDTPVSKRCFEGNSVLPSGEVVGFRSLTDEVGKDRYVGKDRLLVPRDLASWVCGAKRIFAASMASLGAFLESGSMGGKLLENNRVVVRDALRRYGWIVLKNMFDVPAPT